MAFWIKIFACNLVFGSLALAAPKGDTDLSVFFEQSSPGVQGRLLGATKAANGAHPWMVAITAGAASRVMHCGGSILTQRTVLTAAHCIVAVRNGNSVESDVRLIVGTNRFASGGQMLNVARASIHPQYNPNTIKNDIGTVHPSADIAFNNLVAPIGLAFDFVEGGVTSRVAGFGAITNGYFAPASADLLELQVSTMNGAQCARDIKQASLDLALAAPDVDPALELCTVNAKGKGICRGDHGSALVRNDRKQQIGIVSWGLPCARGGPDVYVRVSAYVPWIQQNIY